MVFAATGATAVTPDSASTIDLSIVVVTFVGDECLPDCLAHLHREVADRTGVEVIVVHDDRLHIADAMAAAYPRVRWLRHAGDRHPSVMRAAAVRASHGHHVALIEDHCLVAPGWCDAALEARAANRPVQGGPIEKAQPDTPLNWAGYFLEFAYFMPPIPRDVQRASDCNTVYARAALDEVEDAWRTAFHETTVNWSLGDRGVSIVRDPRQLVLESHHMHAAAALREKVDFGRTYAITRCRRMARRRQLAFAFGAPALPAILSVRMARIAAEHRRMRAFLRAYPWFLLLTIAWGLGELRGYLAGPSGPTQA